MTIMIAEFTTPLTADEIIAATLDRILGKGIMYIPRETPLCAVAHTPMAAPELARRARLESEEA